MEIKYEGSVKIKFSSGKEILLTVEEYNELFGYKQLYIPDETNPYIFKKPSYIEWVITSHT